RGDRARPPTSFSHPPGPPQRLTTWFFARPRPHGAAARPRLAHEQPDAPRHIRAPAFRRLLSLRASGDKLPWPAARSPAAVRADPRLWPLWLRSTLRG